MKEAKKLPHLRSLVKTDLILLEKEENIYHGTLEQLHSYIHLENHFSDVPVSYSGALKGNSISTRGQVFSTIYNLINRLYLEFIPENSLYLIVVDKISERAYFGNWYIEGDFAKMSDDITFLSGDSTSFIGAVIAPYGEILGTEDW